SRDREAPTPAPFPTGEPVLGRLLPCRSVTRISSPDPVDASDPREGGCCAQLEASRNYIQAVATWWPTRASIHPKDRLQQVYPFSPTELRSTRSREYPQLGK